MNEGFGRDFYRKGNSVKRLGPFSEPPNSEMPEKLLSSSPSRKSALIFLFETAKKRERFKFSGNPLRAVP